MENKNLNSKILMAGSRLQNHFYVKVKIDSKKTLFCDAYGIYESDINILKRYNFTHEDIYDFEIVEEKERRCFASWEEAFSDKSYGRAMKELYDTKELGHDRHKYFTKN